MKFMVMVKATAESEAGRMPSREEYEAVAAFNEKLANDGVLLSGGGLRPSSKGTRLHFEDGRTTVMDGPFAETKELVAGWCIVQGNSRAEIVEILRHAPFSGASIVEVRELMEAEDFGDAATPEAGERNKRALGRA